MSIIWDDLALVGRVARPHGIRGDLIVNPETDFPEDRFAPGAELFIRRGAVVDRITVTRARMQQGRPVVGLLGVDDVETALPYAGLELRVPLEQLSPLPAGAFYRHDLIGCQVVTTNGRLVGTVRGVEGTLGGSRLVVEDEAGAEVLVPLALEICVSILPAERRIVVAPPEGLLDLNVTGRRARSRSKRQADS
jgi:16S rRNA processing protein RimM